MAGLSYNIVNFEPSMFPGQFKVLRIKYSASFQSLLDRNCAIPILAEKSSRGVLLANLIWEWTARGQSILTQWKWTLTSAGHFPLEVTGYL